MRTDDLPEKIPKVLYHLYLADYWLRGGKKRDRFIIMRGVKSGVLENVVLGEFSKKLLQKMIPLDQRVSKLCDVRNQEIRELGEVKCFSVSKKFKISRYDILDSLKDLKKHVC